MSPSLRQFMLVSVVGMTLLLASLLFFHIELSRDYLQDHLSAHNRNLAIVLRARKRVAVELINGQPARESLYLEALGRIFQAVNDHKQIFLENR